MVNTLQENIKIIEEIAEKLDKNKTIKLNEHQKLMDALNDQAIKALARDIKNINNLKISEIAKKLRELSKMRPARRIQKPKPAVRRSVAK